MKPGDLVFCHSSGFVSRCIRFMQRLRNDPEQSHWNHVAILFEENDGDWTVIQAQGAGVSIAYLSDIAPGGTYEIVACPTRARAKVVAFAESQVGRGYGFLTVASVIIDIITPKRLALRKPGTWICSALAAAALWYAGWPKSQGWADLYQVSPADLYGASTS